MIFKITGVAVATIICSVAVLIVAIVYFEVKNILKGK